MVRTHAPRLPPGLRRPARRRYIPAGAQAVFLGGSDPAWKYGPEARAVAQLTKDRGLWLHMGRVNSLRRLRYAQAIGCDSADGTYLTYAPDTNLPRLLRFLRQASEPTLFDAFDPPGP